MQTHRIVLRSYNRPDGQIIKDGDLPDATDVIGFIPHGKHDDTFESFMRFHFEKNKHLYERCGRDKEQRYFWGRKASGAIDRFSLELS